ncbi:MAG: RNA 2',3'-cyclic phosphodiesterase [Myxococcales bacterium]
MRLFFCVPLPQEAKDRAARALAPLRKAAGGDGFAGVASREGQQAGAYGGGSGLSWTKPEQMHLTLAFLGEHPSEELDRMYAAAEPCCQIKAFEAVLKGAGAFPNPRRAHVLWLGISEGASELSALAERLCSGLRGAGFELETRPFKPHLTVARVKRGGERDAERALKAAEVGEVARFHVGRLLLMKSELSPKGARHEEVRAFPLTAS